jgi:hypothetical protein
MTQNLRPLVLAALLVSTLVSPAPASAGTTATYVFESVESYNIIGDNDMSSDELVEVTGVVQGESSPRTVTLKYSPRYPSSDRGTDFISSKRTFERCERLALLAMSKPGQYLLELRQERNTVVTETNYIGCKLTRRVP